MPRLEDRRLLTGRGCYSSDVPSPGALHAVVLRAPHAAARILAIDTSAAEAATGVRAVLTGADYAAEGNRPIRHAANPPDALVPARPWFVAGPDCFLHEIPQPPLAIDEVRFAGEGVALVVAETVQAARDAAERIAVEYAPLPAVIGARAALQPGAAALAAGAHGNCCLDVRLGDTAATDAAFARAALVIEQEFSLPRIANCQMEPRAALGEWNAATGRLTLTAGSQGVVRQRVTLAECLNLPVPQVRVVSPDVGGGFGPRTPLSPEAVLVAWAARRLGHAVRWISDRGEAFLTDFQARDLETRAALALDADGRILALRCGLLGNIGAYTASFVPLANGSRIVSTVYDVPVAAVHLRGALTNSVPIAPFRGAGRPEATHAIESLLDAAARRLGQDRVAIRARNLIPRAALPRPSVMGLPYDSGDFPANMHAALRLADWDGFSARREASQARGLLRGIGIANYIETPVGAPRERLRLLVDPAGRVDLEIGTHSTGQGHDTTFAQVCGELLGLAPDRMRLRTGDSDITPVGGGTHSDRSMRLAGALLVEATATLQARAREAAALLLAVPEADLAFNEGGFTAPDGRQLGLFAIAAALRGGSLPEQLGRELEATAEINERIHAYPTGCAVAELEIDPETGLATLASYASVDDVGQAINPLVVDGQVHGGIAQGVGQALYEQVVLEPGSGQMLTGSFMDYCLPRADRLPFFQVSLTEDPTSGSALRVKGGGEGGITPAIAVVANALADALGDAAQVALPATPERIWRALRNTAPP